MPPFGNCCGYTGCSGRELLLVTFEDASDRVEAVDEDSDPAMLLRSYGVCNPPDDCMFILGGRVGALLATCEAQILSTVFTMGELGGSGGGRRAGGRAGGA